MILLGAKWLTKNSIAIWDNRSAFHTATFDYEGLGERFGHRAVGIGEAPYLDPNSKSRSEVLSATPSLGDSGKSKGVERGETVSA